MPIYNYVVKDPTGKTIKGTVEGPTPNSAADALRAKNYIIISLAEKRPARGIEKFFERFKGVSLAERTIFARQLSTMISAGLPLTNALEILRAQTENEKMREVTGEMLSDVQGGMSLSKSMGKHLDVFANVTVALVEAGEASGKLDQLLDQLADNLEKERDFQSKARGALVYPAVIALAMVGVFIVMLVFVIPNLSSLYEEIGVSLPFSTRVLIGLSDLFIRGWWAIIIIFGGLVYAISRYSRTEAGSYQFARIGLRVPILGKLNKETDQARFARTLGLLIGAGIPIIQALEISAHAVNNLLYRDVILNAQKEVEKGGSLSSAIKKDPIFDPLLGQMIAVGEETGKMDEVLDKVASFFESRIEELVKNLSAALEPVILIVLGVMIGFLVLAIITPIYNLTAQF